MIKLESKKNEKAFIKLAVVCAYITPNENKRGSWGFASKEKLKEFIQGITSQELKREDTTIYFILSPVSQAWFEDLYKPEFFEIDEKQGIIKIKPLPNGIRRARVYHKRTDNNKTFHKVYERIVKTLRKGFMQESFAPFFRREKENAIQETIHIHLIESPESFNLPQGGYDGEVKILFNKEKWTYEIVMVKAIRDIKKIESVVRRGFEKHTASTRNYRSKKK